ncbi:MAG: hypothetical protein ACFB13_07500 [Kiloniellaceae bacterium]
MRQTIARTIVAFLIGVVWVVYTGFAGSIFLDAILWPLLFMPGFYLFTIALVACLPWIRRQLPGKWGAVLAFGVLTAAHALVLDYLGITAPWFKVVALGGVYAAFAVFASRVMIRGEGESLCSSAV